MKTIYIYVERLTMIMYMLNLTKQNIFFKLYAITKIFISIFHNVSKFIPEQEIIQKNNCDNNFQLYFHRGRVNEYVYLKPFKKSESNQIL